MSKYAAENSTLSKKKGDYLKKLGFNKELLEEFENGAIKLTVTDWLREGAFLEDEGSYFDAFGGKARYNNHFHNPFLKDWNKAGLSDLQNGESSVLWAQDSSRQGSSVGSDWSWQKTRLCYYYAFTVQKENDRQSFFACTFEGLGHQMHLIQDASVPAHVRNDAHPRETILGTNPLTGDYYFETWTKKNIPNAATLKNIASNPLFPQVALNVNRNINGNSHAPITQFIDSMKYSGTMPSTSLTWGLAEYTNSNFVSDGTIFTENFSSGDGHYFPFPRHDAQCYELITEHLSTNKNRTYLKKYCEGETIDHFAAISPFYKYLSLFAPSLKRSDFVLNAAVHYDYAQKLIPRAVGYSAALLNYFFRGDINLKYESGTNPGYVITNNSDENMNGTFRIFYDKKDDSRTELWNGTLSINAHGKSGRVVFQEPALEDAKEPGKYILVFRGTLGNEKDAVAGRVAGRLLEITPPAEYVYSIIDGSIDPQQFTRIKAKIRNATGEEIKNGTLQAVAKYIKRTDYEPDLSEDPPTPETREADLSYSVSEQIPITSLSATNPAEITFNFTSNPIPAGITDLYLQIIFTGTVGDEADTASAIGTKDLSEPTHHVFWNLSDMFFLNGQLYTAEEIRNDPDLASQVDLDHDGILNEVDINEPYIDPVEINFKIAYFGTNPPAGPVLNAASVDKLAAGRHIRLLLLLDRLENNYLRLTWSDNIYSESYYDFFFSGALNQEVRQKVNGQEEIVFNYTPPTEFRAWLDSDGITQIPIRQHFSQGILSCLPHSAPHGCSYPAEEAIPANPEPVPVTVLFP